VPTTEELGRVLAANLFFIPAEPIGWGDGHLFVLNGVLWSLMWEMAVSLAYGLAGRRLDNLALAAVITAAGVLLLGFAFQGGITDGWQRSAFFEGGVRALFGFSAGIAMARLMKAGAFRKMPGIPGWAPMAVLCAILFLPKWEGFDPAIDVLMIMIAFPLIVIAGAVAAPCSGTSRKIFRWIGDISYPLYAVHAPLLVIAFASGKAFGFSLFVLCILGYALSLAVAHVALVRWDAPLRRWLSGVRMAKAAGVNAA
jgi:peptidoglycan/LPS O-acetylase OafA/YrhL